MGMKKYLWSRLQQKRKYLRIFSVRYPSVTSPTLIPEVVSTLRYLSTYLPPTLGKVQVRYLSLNPLSGGNFNSSAPLLLHGRVRR